MDEEFKNDELDADIPLDDVEKSKVPPDEDVESIEDEIEKEEEGLDVEERFDDADPDSGY